MPTKRLGKIVHDLSFEKKLITAGSLLMIISAVLPWYQDLDSFRTGDMFLGISGPLYLAGFSLIILAVINLALVFSDFTELKIPRIPFKKHVLFMFTGIFAFYALFLVNSVYFHPKFGVNITLKQSQFGMFLAFVSASLITIGGYISMKDKKEIIKEFRETTVDQIIPLPVQERNPEINIRKDHIERRGSRETVVSPESIEQIQMANLTPKVDSVVDTSQNGNNRQTYRMDL